MPTNAPPDEPVNSITWLWNELETRLSADDLDYLKTSVDSYTMSFAAEVFRTWKLEHAAHAPLTPEIASIVAVMADALDRADQAGYERGVEDGKALAHEEQASQNNPPAPSSITPTA